MKYPQSVRKFLWSDVKWLLFWVVSFALIGGIFGYLLIGILMGLLAFIFRQWRALYLLHDWVKFRNTEHPPSVDGILSELSQDFFRIYKKETRLHETLINNVRRTRECVSALEEAVVLINAKNNIDWWNPASEHLLGLKNGDQQSNILNIIREPNFIHYYREGDYRQHFHMVSWLNPKKHLQFEITPFGDNDRLIIVDDISRIVNLEQMRKDFIANVSHELRTPLTVFSGYLETFMDQDGLSPMWQRAFSQMQQQTTRMNNIVNDLLMLSRLESDVDQAEHSKIDMPDMMMQLFDLAQAANIENGHVINLNIESQQSLCGNKKELMSAFSNIIYNAMKYTPKNGDISISWQMVNCQGVFSVEDNGIGIAEEHIDRLTERFYRVDSGRSRETGGTGLGLAIVKHVLYRHDATLEIMSTPNKGSTFSAVFPTSRFCH